MRLKHFSWLFKACLAICLPLLTGISSATAQESTNDQLLALTSAAAQTDITATIVQSQQEAKIRKALQNDFEFNFPDTLFGDVASTIQQKLAITLVVHESARDNGLAEDEIVQVEYSMIKLRSGLNLLLDQHDCTYAVKDDVLNIVSKETAEEDSFQIKALYDISNLEINDVDELAKAAQASVLPDSWLHAGGTGSMVPLTVNGRKLLAVKHTENGQQQIHQFLNTINLAVFDKEPVVSSNPQTETRYYMIPDDVKVESREIVAMVTNTLDEIQFADSSEHYAKSYGNIVVVKHNQKALKSIDQLMGEIGLRNTERSSDASAGGFGGGGRSTGGGVFAVPELTKAMAFGN